jgi:hypothetical protein
MVATKNWVGNPFMCTGGRPAFAQAVAGEIGPWQTGLNPPILTLFSNNLVVGQGTVAADLVTCVFTGYADQQTLPLPMVDANGNSMISSLVPASFIAGTIGTPDVAYGWGLLDTETEVLLAVENFDLPFHFAATGDRLELAWRVYLPPTNQLLTPGS